MLWTLIAEFVIAALLVVAGVFALVGSLGLIKLDDTMRRLHGPTKATTLGVGGILVASMLYSAVFLGRISAHELMITIFLFLTAPITANIIAKAYLHRNVGEKDVPPAPGRYGWSIYEEAPPEDRRIDTT